MPDLFGHVEDGVEDCFQVWEGLRDGVGGYCQVFVVDAGNGVAEGRGLWCLMWGIEEVGLVGVGRMRGSVVWVVGPLIE